jgi:hypothetical protein
MIEPGSKVIARDSGRRGVVRSRWFDCFAREWLYKIEWPNGASTVEPFLALHEDLFGDDDSCPDCGEVYDEDEENGEISCPNRCELV